MIYKNVSCLCKQRGISIAKLEKETGLGNGSIGRWRESSPRVESLAAVAAFFGVTVDYFLNSHDHETT